MSESSTLGGRAGQASGTRAELEVLFPELICLAAQMDGTRTKNSQEDHPHRHDVNPERGDSHIKPLGSTKTPYPIPHTIQSTPPPTHLSLSHIYVGYVYTHHILTYTSYILHPLPSFLSRATPAGAFRRFPRGSHAVPTRNRVARSWPPGLRSWTASTPRRRARTARRWSDLPRVSRPVTSQPGTGGDGPSECGEARLKRRYKYCTPRVVWKIRWSW